jgi:hypothetical protein
LFIKHIFNSLLYHAGRLCFWVHSRLNFFHTSSILQLYTIFLGLFVSSLSDLVLHAFSKHFFISFSLFQCFFTLHFSHLQHYFL